MQVKIEHFIDASEPDTAGNYEYYYEYDLYTFSSEDGYSIKARSYTDTPEEVSLLGKFLTTHEYEQNELFRKADFDSDFVQSILRYLKLIGKEQCQWLDSDNRETGYSDCPESI